MHKAQTPPIYTQLILGQWAMGQKQERVWSGGGEKGEVYFGIPVQALLGEMSYWDDIQPKREKNELESLGACHRS